MCVVVVYDCAEDLSIVKDAQVKLAGWVKWVSGTDIPDIVSQPVVLTRAWSVNAALVSWRTDTAQYAGRRMREKMEEGQRKLSG